MTINFPHYSLVQKLLGLDDYVTTPKSGKNYPSKTRYVVS